MGTATFAKQVTEHYCKSAGLQWIHPRVAGLIRRAQLLRRFPPSWPEFLALPAGEARDMLFVLRSEDEQIAGERQAQIARMRPPG